MPSHVILYVSDLDASVAFYRDILGFEHAFTDAGYAEFRTGETRFAVYERRRAEWLTGHTVGPGAAGEIVVTVDDVDAETARLAGLGVTALAPPTDRSWGHRTAHFADPDGFVVELAQVIPRHRDRRVPTVDVSRVTLTPAAAGDAAEFVAAVSRSIDLLHPWAFPPATVGRYREWLETGERFLVRTADTGELAGHVSLQNIVRSAMLSVTLGYAGFRPHVGRGLMAAGVAAATDHCFDVLALHRVEACIRPENTRSIALVRRIGFRHEGTSPRLLFLDGAWRDHERFALTSREWPTPAVHLRRS